MCSKALPTSPPLRTDFTTRPVAPDDLPDIKALHALAFGPGRFTRTAYRIREGTGDISPFCLAAILEQRIAAALRLTQITIGGTPNALMLGPLVVAPDLAGQGIGRELVRQGLANAKARGIRLVLLVGDAPYYARFGFAQVPPNQIQMPGPVDPARLLAVELEAGVLAGYRGMVTAVRG